ncbi:MAG: dihydroxy-acid dehydratase [Thermoanaerobacteraceae bacterium]|jgi:dihydroxy-acid dehydratase|nr:dihydroxy-acid dehydratase [Thermoanaerobacteraceae bacterium]
MTRAIDNKPPYLRALIKMHLASMGIPVETIDSGPIIGIVNSWNEIIQGHYPQKELAEKVKKGIFAAGGIALEFNTIGICDGIAQGHEGMKYSLPSRELINYSIEAMVYGHGIFDGLVFIGSCDKIIPAFLKSAFRINLPSIFIGSGPAFSLVKPRMRKESRQAFLKGEISEKELIEKNLAYYGGPGVCPFLGTANTMNILIEALGLSLPYSGTAPSNSWERLSLAEKTGRRIIELVKDKVTPLKLIKYGNFYNALIVLLATGGSLNAIMHLIDAASAAGYEIPLSLVNELNEKVPLLVKIDPNDDEKNIVDLHCAGGIPAVMKELIRVLKTEAVGVDGLTVKEKVASVNNIKKDVIRDYENPYDSNSGIVVLFGNLAPGGALLKTAGVDKTLYFQGKARVFNKEEECREALENNDIKEGEILVIKNEGPIGGPGMREMHRITEMIKRYKNVALITDGRFSGASTGLVIGYITPEAAAGGPIGYLESGDEIIINIKEKSINCFTNQKIANYNWKFNKKKNNLSWLDIYRMFASSALQGGGMFYE